MHTPHNSEHDGELGPPDIVVDPELIGSAPTRAVQPEDGQESEADQRRRRGLSIMIGGTFIALWGMLHTESQSGRETISTPYEGGRETMKYCVTVAAEKIHNPYLANITRICDSCRERLARLGEEHPCEESAKDMSPQMIDECKGDRMEVARGAKDYCDSISAEED